MKKIIYVILGVLLFLPVLVKADMGAPMIKEYKASVKNPNGADIYRYDFDNEKYVKTGDKLKYGTIIIINNEEDGWISIDTGEESEEEEENEEEEEDLYVQLKELTAVDKTYKVNSKELDTAISALIVKDQTIRKGPAYGYESTGKTIKAGTTVKARGLLEYNEEDKKYYDEGNPWMYVEYNGTKGFIEAYEGKVAFNKVTTTIMANDDAEVTSPQTGKKVGIIKANKKINLTLYTLDAWNDGYYVEYDGVKGYVSEDVVFPKQETLDFKITEKIKVYESLKSNDEGDLTAKVVATLPKSTSFSSNYYLMLNGWAVVYYENGNVKGWISENEGTYNPDEFDENYEYRSIDEILGFEYPEDENILEEEEQEEKTDVVEEKKPTDAVPEKAPSSVKKSNKDSKQTLYYCLGAAVVVSITAVVTILLVNKKKKKTEEPKTDDTTPVEEKKE